MTVIAINTPSGRLSVEQRRTLAQTLTDAVLVPEIGQDEPAARVGFGLTDGDAAKVTTSRGSAIAVVELGDRFMPGHAALPNEFGLGIQQPDGSTRRDGVWLNDLTDDRGATRSRAILAQVCARDDPGRGGVISRWMRRGVGGRRFRTGRGLIPPVRS